MGNAIAESVMSNWGISLGAATAGFLIGMSILSASYLGPLARLHLAPDPAARRRVLEGEAGRLRRLGDAAAVLEEHGRPEAGDLHAEIDLRVSLLALSKRQAEP